LKNYAKEFTFLERAFVCIHERGSWLLLGAVMLPYWQKYIEERRKE
jgi:hypothetical protein